MNISFDFDNTLTDPRVRSMAVDMRRQGATIWIVTSRWDDENAPSEAWNMDLWGMADRLKIPKERVIFMNFRRKVEFFEQSSVSFEFHIDDCSNETDEIRQMMLATPRREDRTRRFPVPINHFNDPEWHGKCWKIFERAKNG